VSIFRMLVALMAVAAGCAAPFRCPARGGPPWWQLESEHFTVATDLEREEAELALRDLEEYRAALADTAWPQGDRQRGGRLQVVIVARERDWRVFETKRHGLYTESLFQPFIAMRAAASDQTRITIRHELTHYLSRMQLPEQPDWLAEGLATYFETMVYDRAGGELLIGMPLPSRLGTLRSGGFNVALTLTGRQEDQDSDRFYATSWLIVHYFMSRQREPFAGYLKALEQGQPAARAWGTAFAHLDLAALQAELRAHVGEGRPLVGSRRFRAPGFTTRARPLDDATVHALRAQLYLGGQGRQAPPAAQAAARGEIDEALAGDRTHVPALAVLAWALEQPVDLEAARAATRRAPEDWLAWTVLYRAAGGDMRSAESRRAAALALRRAAASDIRLPFAPPSGATFASASVAAQAAPDASGSAACRDPGDGTAANERGCPPRNRREREDRTPELKAVASTDVPWCFFEYPEVKLLEVTVDLDSGGRVTSVCPGPVPQPQLAACVQKMLAGVTFPAPGCPRRRRFGLGLNEDGGITVFAR
jgi:hypothetical protein